MLPFYVIFISLCLLFIVWLLYVDCNNFSLHLSLCQQILFFCITYTFNIVMHQMHLIYNEYAWMHLIYIHMIYPNILHLHLIYIKCNTYIIYIWMHFIQALHILCLLLLHYMLFIALHTFFSNKHMIYMLCITVDKYYIHTLNILY